MSGGSAPGWTEYYTDLRQSRSQSSGLVAQKTVMLGEVKTVMAGLDPAIHLLRKYALRRLMDTRVKPAYDDGEYRSALPAITTDYASFDFRELCRRLASPAGRHGKTPENWTGCGGRARLRPEREERAFPCKTRISNSRYDFTISRRDSPEVFYQFPQPSNQRAQGMPGADAPRQKVCT
jgi:hypothetical protein